MRSFVQRLPMRLIWLKVHLWLALTAGFFFVLVGLTGSISVYSEGIDEFLNPQLVIDNPQGDWQSLDRIMTSVRNAHPKRYGSWTLEMPRSPHSMMTAWYDKPTETFFELYAPLMVSVNPYTADVVASRFWGQTVTTWLLDVHTQLLMNRFGWNTVGILGVLLGISVCSGLYLWWPGAGNIGSALKINYRAGVIKLLFDVHRVTGILIAPVLLLLALTGFMLSYPAILEMLVGSSGMAHGETGRTIASTATPNDHPTGLESAEFVARGAFPKGKLRRITTPAGNTGIYRINLRQLGEINERHPFTTVWVDRWSGQTREVRDPFRFTSGETALTWIWPLHTGEALGSKARFIWFLSGFGLCFLYVSGLLRWLHRRGNVQDRPVDTAAVQVFFQSALKTLAQSVSWLLHFTQMAIKLAMPTIKRVGTILLGWFYQLRTALFNRQKRIDKS
jgi:uncharacterized iron-regulated membrane protein